MPMNNMSLAPIDQTAPGANLGAYIQAVHRIPVLSAERERELADALFHHGDLDAARELVMSHLRFVVHIARSYKGYGLSEGDLIQEGNVGLMKAVKRFNPEHGARLVSFAIHWIKSEIHDFILRNWRIVKVATTKAQRKLFFNLRSRKKQLGWLTEAEAEAVARDLGVDVAEVKSMESRLSSRDVAFDAPVDADDEEAWQAPAHYLEDRRNDPALLAERADRTGEAEQRLREALAELDPRSRDILTRRWLAEAKATLHELAAAHGISAERVRQLEQGAMQKLRDCLEGEPQEA